ncbi:MAG: hypothetical protein J3Q66DRAFT_373217 [Benniella sp.]|nr:MAG: hypothetical protein J3Q66DRAFT_373217 [Benniella sp.]
MPSLHPLEIPEILLGVASYVPVHNLPACARVSKIWHQAFIPLIWKDVRLFTDGAIPLGAIHSHGKFVKNLQICCRVKQEHVALNCQNLTSVYVSRLCADSLEFITKHPSVTQLRFLEPIRGLSGYWDKLIGLPNLKDLRVVVLEVMEQDADTFWQLCTRLERLDMGHPRVLVRGNLSSMEFPSLYELRMNGLHESDVRLVLDFMQRCPNLRSLRWALTESVLQLFAQGFVQLYSAGTWPHLQNLSARLSGSGDYGDDSDLSKVIGVMQRITSFKASSFSFTPELMDLFRPHFSNLQNLNVCQATTFTSAMTQEVMSSCPLLTSFKGVTIDAIDITQGRPWTCLKLKLLKLGFCFDPSTIDRMQPLVLDQLSRLTRLEDLEVYSWRQEPLNFQEGFDLRLEHGLGKLSTLRQLRILDLGDSKQNMGEQEVDWIIEHWKCLVRIYGRLNTMAPNVEKALAERLNRHDIAN